jgi:predicted peptidase
MLKNSTIDITVYPQTYKFPLPCIIYTPDNYDPVNKKYPLVIFGHGTGEAGTDLTAMYRQGLPLVLNSGFMPLFDCVILMPQSPSYGIHPEWLPTMVKSALSRFSIDPSRVYLTGLSAGGFMCYGSVLDVFQGFGSTFAAIAVLSGATQDANTVNIGWWKVSPVPVWAIVGGADSSYVGENQFLTGLINAQVPGLAKMSIRPGIGHGGWTDIYNGSFKENNQTIWDWLIQFTNGMILPPPVKIVSAKLNFTDGTSSPVQSPKSILSVEADYSDGSSKFLT